MNFQRTHIAKISQGWPQGCLIAGSTTHKNIYIIYDKIYKLTKTKQNEYITEIQSKDFFSTLKSCVLTKDYLSIIQIDGDLKQYEFNNHQVILLGSDWGKTKSMTSLKIGNTEKVYALAINLWDCNDNLRDYDRFNSGDYENAMYITNTRDLIFIASEDDLLVFEKDKNKKNEQKIVATGMSRFTALVCYNKYSNTILAFGEERIVFIDKNFNFVEMDVEYSDKNGNLGGVVKNGAVQADDNAYYVLYENGNVIRYKFEQF